MYHMHTHFELFLWAFTQLRVILPDLKISATSPAYSDKLKLQNRFYSFRKIYYYEVLAVSISPTYYSGLYMSFK
jgi:hypothetical protein